MAKRLPSFAHTATTSHLTALSPDEQRLILSHIGEPRDLAVVACVSRAFCVLAREERRRRRLELVRVQLVARRQLRQVRAEIFSAAETDARLIASVIRHCLLHACTEPAYTKLCGRKPLSGGVHRLRVGLIDGPGSSQITLDTRRAACVTDALAMQETTLRTVLFCGEPLGAVGAAVAVRQAKVLGLDVPSPSDLHGRVFKIFLRSDRVASMMESSPTLAQLIVPEDAS